MIVSYVSIVMNESIVSNLGCHLRTVSNVSIVNDRDFKIQQRGRD